ncbi:Hypothetical predicted protein [Prunus dulcis]|uniref:Serine protease inhibitor, potato inhibitor I-type family protein n=1 Tax=Prunus dulcis TaxID=3755 RepID=A0A5E4EK57_PRUDU|nr:Hypothetical predicted protein [Prunus dulcis]
MSSECQGKDTWPELLGAQGTVAEAIIERENSLVDAQIVLEGTIVTADFRCDRVSMYFLSCWELGGRGGCGEGEGEDIAEAKIQREKSLVNIEMVVEGTIVPPDFVCIPDMVRVWVDTDGLVTRVPVIG